MKQTHRFAYFFRYFYAIACCIFLSVGCDIDIYEDESVNNETAEGGAETSASPDATPASKGQQQEAEDASQASPSQEEVAPASPASVTAGANPVAGLTGWYEDRGTGMLIITDPGIAGKVVRAGYMYSDAANGKLWDGIPKTNGEQVRPGVWSVGQPLSSFPKPLGWLVNMSLSYSGPFTEQAGGWKNLFIKNGSLQ